LDPVTFGAADPLVDEIAKIVDSVLGSEQLAELRNVLAELGKAIGPRYLANLTLTLDICDRDGERNLPLLTTGLSTIDSGPPYRTWGDSSLQRYILNGEIHVVPHDHCPKSWGVWDFKFEHRSCQHCDVTLGQGCKILLDSDVCPSCEAGNVSMTNLVCDKCGYKVDLSVVAWG
jgi:hypothetical protein